MACWKHRMTRAEGAIAGQDRPLFTNRMAAWCWRVHRLAPELETDWVTLFAELCAWTEMCRDVLGEPMDLSGLWAYLGLRVWESEAGEDVYIDLARKGNIGPMRPSSKRFWELELKLRPDDKKTMELLRSLESLPDDDLENWPPTKSKRNGITKDEMTRMAAEELAQIGRWDQDRLNLMGD